jgi:DNA-binding CsgD family transcriptional regulator
LSAPLLQTRTLRPSNLAPVAQWLGEELPLPGALRASLQQLLGALVLAEAIKGILIEEYGPTGEVLRLAGLGLSVFIADNRMARHVASPQPFVFADILREASTDPSAVLDRNAIARANAAQGLNLVVNYMQRGWDLTNAHWRAVGALGHQTYVTHHSGYHLRSALQEDWSGNREIYLAAGYRGLAVVPVEPALLPRTAVQLSSTRTIFYAERPDVEALAPGSTLAHVFQWHPPRLRFSMAEQRLLVWALDGATDIELADQLGLSLTTVKHTWQSIYHRAHAMAPFVVGDEGEDGKRGPEKRRRILGYVEQHPEELRPYALPRGKN